MELKQIKLASEAPTNLQRAAKVALSVGAVVYLSNDQSSLMAQFNGSDKYYFDPENVTLHAFEALGQARTYGFINGIDNPLKRHFPVNIWYSVDGVAAAIGPYYKHRSVHANACTATREVIVATFCAYYDHVAYPET